MISVIVNGIKEVILEIQTGLVEAVIDIFMEIKNFIMGIVNGVKSVVVEIVTGLKEEIVEMKDNIDRLCEPLNLKMMGSYHDWEKSR